MVTLIWLCFGSQSKAISLSCTSWHPVAVQLPLDAERPLPAFNDVLNKKKVDPLMKVSSRLSFLQTMKWREHVPQAKKLLLKQPDTQPHHHFAMILNKLAEWGINQTCHKEMQQHIKTFPFPSMQIYLQFQHLHYSRCFLTPRISQYSFGKERGQQKKHLLWKSKRKHTQKKS